MSFKCPIYFRRLRTNLKTEEFERKLLFHSLLASIFQIIWNVLQLRTTLHCLPCDAKRCNAVISESMGASTADYNTSNASTQSRDWMRCTVQEYTTMPRIFIYYPKYDDNTIDKVTTILLNINFTILLGIACRKLFKTGKSEANENSTLYSV